MGVYADWKVDCSHMDHLLTGGLGLRSDGPNGLRSWRVLSRSIAKSTSIRCWAKPLA